MKGKDGPTRWTPALSNKWGRLAQGNDAGVWHECLSIFNYYQKGPEWKNVTCHITIDTKTDTVIEDITITSTTTDKFLHRQLPFGVHATKTIPFYNPCRKTLKFLAHDC